MGQVKLIILQAIDNFCTQGDAMSIFHCLNTISIEHNIDWWTWCKKHVATFYRLGSLGLVQKTKSDIPPTPHTKYCSKHKTYLQSRCCLSAKAGAR